MKKHTVKFLLLLVIVFSVNLSFPSIEVEDSLVESTSALIPHSLISITNDSDFIQYGFPGDGTSSNPYRIENYIITTEGFYGIEIRDVNSYFTIDNCYLANQEKGIYIYQTGTGRAIVSNNTCTDQVRIGIYIQYSDHVRVENNTVFNINNNGMEIRDNFKAYVSENKCYGNRDNGILFVYGDNSTIIDNECFDNVMDGLAISSSDFSLVENNLCYQNDIGIDSYSSNTLFNVNNCSNNRKTGLSIRQSNCTVNNNTCENNKNGITVKYAKNSLIINNTCINNTENGLYFEYSASSSLINNSMLKCGINIVEYRPESYLTYNVNGNKINGLSYGFFTNINNTNITAIYGEYFLVNCTKTVIQNKYIQDVSIGIKLVLCNETKIKDNVILNSFSSMKIENSKNTEILNNTCENSVLSAISFTDSTNQVIANNTIYDCLNDGLYMHESNTSYIVNNTFSNVYLLFISLCDRIDFESNEIETIFGMYFTLSYERAASFINNNFTKGGLFLFSMPNWDNISMINNWIKGLPLGLIRNTNDTVIDEPYGQLFLVNCHRITLKNQNIEKVPIGIFMDSCSYCTLADITLNNLSFSGLLIVDSSYVEITNNYINGSKTGITSVDSDYTLINQNTISNNSLGIEIDYYSDYCTITHNLIENNSGYGVWIRGDYNKIHHNRFIDNVNSDPSYSQALDWGSGNVWYDIAKLEGNYWSDYSGDGPYLIDEGSEDPYPLDENGLPFVPEFQIPYWLLITSTWFTLVVLVVKISIKKKQQ